MCLGESLQQRSYNVAIFHISLSCIQILFLARFVFQENYFTKSIRCKKESSEALNQTESVKSLGLKENDENILTDEIDELEDGCYIGVITSLSIALILIIDLSMNFLLCHSVRERNNILFIPWLITQALRILFCVIAICLFINLYVFDKSRMENIDEKHSEKMYTILSDTDSMYHSSF